MAYRLTPDDAHAILADLGILGGADFHALRAEQVRQLLNQARACGYREPKNANGSRARYFHAYLDRRAHA